ncbi:MAG: phosphomannomutase/phosphoglucomutase [Eubacteriaceae bacterium]|nr:phosphomannomutase/phosphoglucomutase [Eubacteriaceae bacterium]
MIINGITDLQNGSDVRGIALEGIEGEHINLTVDMAMKIAYSFSIWLKERTGKDRLTVSVGHDSRLTGKDFDTAICLGLVSNGNFVYDCGLATTPSMFMTTVDPEMNCDGAVMITASHMPFNRNGIKLFTKEGGMEQNDLSDVLKQAEVIETSMALGGKKVKHHFLPTYAANIVKIIQKRTGETKPLTGAKIIVDAGNGAGGFFCHDVLDQLGADTTGSQFLEPDGRFPNHIPNPENEKAMNSAVQAVTHHHADMGIIFDTDVDRAAVIDEKGHPINRNGFIAFMAHMILADYPGTTIVTDSITSTGLTEYIESLGGIHHRFKRGYKNVINEAIRLNQEGQETHLAMETSGHGAIKENYFLDDGAYLVTMALIEYTHLHKNGQPLSSFLSQLKEPVETMEIRYVIHNDDFKTYGQNVLISFKKFAENQKGWSLVQPNYEGIRVACDQNSGNGWCLLRMSLHEPKMPLNIESEEKGGCQIIKATFEQFVSKYGDLKA